MCNLKHVYSWLSLSFPDYVISKEICEANTTIMCPMCEENCDPWTLSDSCVYAKVSAVLIPICSKSVFQYVKSFSAPLAHYKFLINLS